MIEPTDEMMEAFYLAGQDGPDITAGLYAVLAIVERDYQALAYCNNALAPGIVCKRLRHTAHAKHYTVGASGSGISWE